MKCLYCNADVSPADKICPKCHHSVQEASPTSLAQKKKQKYINVGVAVIAFIFIITTIGITMSSQQDMGSKVTGNTTIEHGNNPSIDITYQRLQERYNDNSMAQKQKVLLKDIAVDNTSFQYNISEHILFSGQIDPASKQIISLEMIAVPSDNDDMVKMVSIIGVLAESFAPSNASDVRKAVLADLGFKKDADLKNIDNVSIQGNIKYHFSFVQDTGYVLEISSKVSA